MWPVFVVLPLPLAHNLANLCQIPEQVQIQNLIAQTAVKAFDKSILVGFAGLDIVDEDAVILAPAHKHLPQELGAVVHREV